MTAVDSVPAKIITNGPHGMPVSRLRPGMHVLPLECKHPVCVIQNSRKLAKIEIRYSDGFQATVSHQALDLAIYVGSGKRRAWWPFLPRWLRRYVCPFTPPVKKQR